jgi:hypothetical protein
MPSRLQTITVATAAGLTSLVVAVVGLPALADAATTGASPTDAVDKRVTAIRESLQGLVDDKTLTDAQADKVAETLGEKGGPFPGDGFRHGGPRFFIGGGMEDAAKVLGMSVEDVRAALRDGTTLAELAKQKGKSVDDVVAALTSGANQRIDQAVKDGKITQAQGDEAKKKVAEGTKSLVEQGFPMRGHGLGKLGPGGPDGPGFPRWKDGAPDAPATPAPTPSGSASTSSFSA